MSARQKLLEGVRALLVDVERSQGQAGQAVEIAAHELVAAALVHAAGLDATGAEVVARSRLAELTPECQASAWKRAREVVARQSPKAGAQARLRALTRLKSVA